MSRMNRLKIKALAALPLLSIGVLSPVPDMTIYTGPLGSPPGPISLANRYSDPQVSTVVRMATNSGNLDIALFGSAAPGTVANFLQYVNAGRYNNTIFHRSVPFFVIQGGGFQTPTGTYATFPPNAAATPQPITTFPAINLEHPTGNVRGTIAMARTTAINSATSQFFLNTVNNPALDDPTPATPDAGYAVFGQLLPGSLSVMDFLAGYTATDFSSDFGGAFGQMPLHKAPDQQLGFVTFPIQPSDYLIVNTAAVLPGVAGQMTVSSSNPTLVTPVLAGTNLTLTAAAGQSGSANITVHIVGFDGASVDDVFTVTVSPCGPADVGKQGGIAGADGLLDNNDFIVFIGLFFNADPQADRGVQGGAPGHDGLFTNDDLIVYINQFFSGGC
jgi:cyclophilin family peptidyl-prolyl cis-trans isomerase